MLDVVGVDVNVENTFKSTPVFFVAVDGFSQVVSETATYVGCVWGEGLTAANHALASATDHDQHP